MKKTVVICTVFLILLLGSGVLLLKAGQKEQSEAAALKRGDLFVFLPGSEISALFDDGNALWVGGKGGIQLLDRLTGEPLKVLDAEIKMAYAAGICQTSDGTIWAGHNEGLTAFSAAGKTVYSISAPDIPGGRVNALLPDGDGLWIGTEQGAAYLAPASGNWQVKETLTSANGLAADFTNCITRVGGSLWFGAYLSNQGGGLSIRSPEGWQYVSVKEGLPHRYINAIIPLSEQEVLVGTGHLDRGGLARLRLEDGSWRVSDTWNTDNGIPGEKVRQLFWDSGGQLWITTESHGLLLCESVTALNTSPIPGLYLTEQSGLSDNEIKCIVETEEFFWLGGRLGLTRMERGDEKGGNL